MNKKYEISTIIGYSILALLYLIVWAPVSFYISGLWTQGIVAELPDHNLLVSMWKYTNFFIVFLIIFFIPYGIYNQDELKEKNQCLNCMPKTN